MKNERKIDRFTKYLKIKGINDNKATLDLGLSIGTIGKSRKEGRDLSERNVVKILNFYTDLGEVWLRTGEGEMFRSPSVVASGNTYGDNASGNNNVTISGNNTGTLQARISALQKLIEEKDKQLAQKDELLAERDRLLSEKDKLLAEKDKQLAEKERLVEEKERLIKVLLSGRE